MSPRHLQFNFLKTFQIAANSKSFAEAAKILNLTPSAVSKQIRILEESVNQPLFIRSNKELALTEAGLTLRNETKNHIEAIENTFDSISKAHTKQVIKIIAPYTFVSKILVPKMKTFGIQFPNLDIKVYSDLSYSNLNEEAISTEFDLVLLYTKANLIDARFRLIHIEKLIAVAAPTLFKGGAKPSLLSTPLIHMINDQSNFFWSSWFDSLGISMNHNHLGGLFLSSLEQVIDTALTGAGIALVDEIMVEEHIKKGELMQVSDHFVEGPNGYVLIDTNHMNTKKNLSFLLFKESLEKSLIRKNA